MSTAVWAVVEHDGKEIRHSSLEVLGEAQRIAALLSARVTAVLFGVLDRPVIAAHYGADRVCIVRVRDARGYDPEIFVASLESLIAAETPPRLLLAAATTTGSDLCARLALRLSAPLVPGCVNASERGGRLELIRPMYGGKVHAAHPIPEEGCVLATIPPDVVGVGQPDETRTAEVVEIAPASPSRCDIEVVETVAGDPKTLDLTEAEVIVAAGRGIGRKENLGPLRELADVLGGSIAGSRVAVDLGWLPRERQVGQTGKTVAPKLYLACGISGATQHTVGIKQAEHIVAINVDDGCALFKVADLGIQGDAMAVVPILVRQLREAQGEA